MAIEWPRAAHRWPLACTGHSPFSGRAQLPRGNEVSRPAAIIVGADRSVDSPDRLDRSAVAADSRRRRSQLNAAVSRAGGDAARRIGRNRRGIIRRAAIHRRRRQCRQSGDNTGAAVRLQRRDQRRLSVP